MGTDAHLKQLRRNAREAKVVEIEAEDCETAKTLITQHGQLLAQAGLDWIAFLSRAITLRDQIGAVETQIQAERKSLGRIYGTDGQEWQFDPANARFTRIGELLSIPAPAPAPAPDAPPAPHTEADLKPAEDPTTEPAAG